MTAEEDAAEGRRIRALLWGEDAGAPAPDVSELERLTDEVVFGQVWADPRLAIKLRSLITIAALTALGGRERQLVAHVAGGLAVGLSREEIVAAIEHLAFYAGWPAANTALAVAGPVLEAGHG